MTSLAVGACIVAYFFMSSVSCFYVSKVADYRDWRSADKDAVEFATVFFWPITWLIMLAWFISTKIGVPKR